MTIRGAKNDSTAYEVLDASSHIVGNVWSVFEKCNKTEYLYVLIFFFSGWLTSLTIISDWVCSKLGCWDNFQFFRAWNICSEIHDGSVCFEDSDLL